MNSHSHTWVMNRPLAAIFAAGLALAFTLGVVLVTSVIGASPASAHATLVSITPSAGAVLTKAPSTVVVEFNEPVSTSFATVLVTTSAGVSVVRGKPTVLGGKVTQALNPDLASGGYRIAYKVVSDDGHPVTGQSRFTLRLASGARPSTPAPTASSASSGVPSPSASAAAPSAAAPSAGQTTSGQGGRLSSSAVAITGAVGLAVVIGAGFLLWQRRRR